MITETYLYGNINKAIFKRDDKYFVLNKSSEGEFETSTLSNFELNDFYLSNSEVTVIKNIKWDENKIQFELENDIHKKEALSFFLMGMDTTLSTELRKEAMELLDLDELKNIETQSFINNRIFASKIPESFDPRSTCEIANNLGHDYLAKLYKNLFEAKDIIIAVRNVWKKIILEGTFINPEFNLEYLDKEFTDRGIFSDFVIAILKKNYKDFDNAIIKHSDILKELNISGQPGVLLAYLKESIFKELSLENERIEADYFDDIKNNDKRYEILQEDDFGSKFNKLIENFIGKSKRKKGQKRGLRLKIPFLSNYFNVDVNKQVLWIKNNILSENIEKAEKGILKLIEYQDFYSDKEHLCKSLCDIAGSFQKINDIETSDLIARKAIGLNQNDCVPLSILAENLRANNKLELALNAYDKIIRDFKTDVIPRCGRADTLRQMGKLEEALNAYDETIHDFNSEVVPRSGRAETLRQMGKLEEALTAYDDIIKSFPDNQIPKTARLIILIQMGKNLEDVERELITLVSNAKTDWILFHVYCMFLIKQNKLDEAITKLNFGIENIQDFISRGYYKNALSYAYIRKKQYNQAISHLINEPNLLPLPRVLMTHAYAAEGNLPESKKHFSEIINSQIKKVVETTRYISDRYQIHSQRFFSINSVSELDEIIDSLEFDLLFQYPIAA